MPSTSPKSFQRLLYRAFLTAVVLLPIAAQAAPLQILFLGDSGHHQPATRFAELNPVLRQRGIEMTYTDKMSDLNLDKLNKYDALAVYANIDQISDDQATALLKYVDNGGGFVPLHCATFCFRNNAEIVALMGAQFQRHGTGVFRAESAKTEHPIMKGFGGFQAWDETYVHHLHNDKNRTVLEYRVDEEGREPWTWVRTHGKGRVFYTASGHDARTWTNPGFHNLVERGLRWAAKNDPQVAGSFRDDLPFKKPEMSEPQKNLKAFTFVDVGNEIPNYTPKKSWGTQGDPLTKMQEPVEPAESMKHLVVPKGFHVELFASEPDFQGKPICMAWDERGRLWIAETVDYPNELQPETGRDRIRICEDTDGDGKADKFTVFAEGLSIPTSIAFSRGGVIVQNAIETLYLKDTDGDDVADERGQLISGWQLGDTHGGVSNFQYGLDNWIWAMQGYNNSKPVAKGKEQQQFRMGFFRMRPDGSEVEFIRSTNNNTWGLGISEEGLIFGSTANGNPSVYMPIANRYYERVRGWTPSLTLSSMADTNAFAPITENVRQVDWHGGYTAGAGHALYTAREYPQEYWNRVAFVNGPTGHLTGAFVLNSTGTDFRSSSPFNLLASDDEWTAPIMSEVGPDGNVWVLDWYNFIIQHNPTPKGFKNGKGNAYESKLRDKKHGRIYRVVPDGKKQESVPNLANASNNDLVAALAHPTMLIRKHAQRLLVEKGADVSHDAAVAKSLIALIDDTSVDQIGLNVGSIHALWTLHGLNLLDGSHGDATSAAVRALKHPSAGVRRNALQVLAPNKKSVDALLASGATSDRNAQVRMAAFLALADLPPTTDSASAIVAAIANPSELADRWMPDAMTSAAAHNAPDFLAALSDAKTLPPRGVEMVTVVAEHYARSDANSGAADLIAGLDTASPAALDAVIAGLDRGWPEDANVKLTDATETALEKTLDRIPARSRGSLVKLATRWGSKRLDKYGKVIGEAFLDQVRDASATEEARIAAAQQLIDFRPTDGDVITGLLDELTPQTTPSLANGIMQSLGASGADNAGIEIVNRLATMSPALRQTALLQLLRRPESTRALLQGAGQGKAFLTDLALDQKQALANHPDQAIRDQAKKLLEQGGALPNADRAKVLEEYHVATTREGDVTRGKAVFKDQCSKCHVHSGEGVAVGPNLTGMAIHPKEELMIHILDPSRSVEGNFRAYSVITDDGLTMSGMLASESKTAIEIFDTEGKKKSILREDIDELVMSPKSVMPEGFEKQIDLDKMTDLLEFLADRGKFLPLPFDKIATAASDRSMFANPNLEAERLIFDDWKPKVVEGVPFQITDPKNGTVPNVIVLHGPQGAISRKMPRKVNIPCNGPAKSIHMLSGVSGWGHPYGDVGSTSVIVRLHYADGNKEDHKLLNGKHFADYIRRVDVPDSKFAFQLRGQQLRYLSVQPNRAETINEIELIKGEDDSAPVIMAITIESP